MANLIVAIDESGNTGQNLLDNSQPVFVLASVCFTEEEAKALRGILSSGQEKEIHFNNLIRSNSGRQRIKQFLRSPLLIQNRVKLFVVNKPFMVTSKIVDLLVETLYFRKDINIYRYGANIAMSNLYYYATPAFCGEKRFAKFQSAFVRMIRMKDSPSINAFYASIQELRDFCRDEKFKFMLDTLATTRTILDDVFPYISITTLDPAVPLLYFLSAAWGDQFGCSFCLVCDESKPIAHDRKILEILMDSTIPEVRIGYDYRKMTLPLKASGITFIDSKESIPVQIADLLAGSCAYWAKKLADLTRKDDLFCAIRDSGIPKLIVNAIWPSPAVTPQELGITESDGINPVDYVGQLLKRRRVKTNGTKKKAGYSRILKKIDRTKYKPAKGKK